MAHDVGGVRQMPARRLESVPPVIKVGVPVALVLGVVVFIAALLTDPARAWRAYLFNWLYWTAVAHGAVILAAAVTITRGVWARPIRRIALSSVAFLPISLVLMLPLFFVGEYIFTWFGQDLQGKEVYLNMPFLSARNLLLVGAFTVVAHLFAYWSLRPDLGRLRSEAPTQLRGLYERMTRGWRGDTEEDMQAQRKTGMYAPILTLLWVVALSVVSWDFVMSQEEHWFSALIGPYFFMGGFLGGIVLTAILATIYRARLNLEDSIQSQQFHDLGKLAFGFSVFWAYMFWSQYLTIWYGLLPWEQSFLVHRLEQPYLSVAFVAFAGLFLVPFFGLMGVAPKKRPAILSTFGVIVLIGLWIERYVLIYPSFYHELESTVFGWQELGMALPFAALFIGSITRFATRYPILQLWQPVSEERLEASSEEPPAGGQVTAG